MTLVVERPQGFYLPGWLVFLPNQIKQSKKRLFFLENGNAEHAMKWFMYPFQWYTKMLPAERAVHVWRSSYTADMC